VVTYISASIRKSEFVTNGFLNSSVEKISKKCKISNGPIEIIGVHFMAVSKCVKFTPRCDDA
jgi:hypothetical protein